jgi:hypothetical protein
MISQDLARSISRRAAWQVEDKVGVLHHHPHCAQAEPLFNIRWEKVATGGNSQTATVS